MDNATLKKIADNLEYLHAVSIRVNTPIARDAYAKAKDKITDMIGKTNRQNEKDMFNGVIRTLRAAGRLVAEESDKHSALPADDRDFLNSFPRIRQVRF